VQKYFSDHITITLPSEAILNRAITKSSEAI